MKSYLIICPECKCEMEVLEDDVGKPPFVINCDECGEEVGDENIIEEYE